jgi:hypothetical protein
LYLRVAETLERSARPAEQHATRNRSNGRPDGAAVELERASRAARRLGTAACSLREYTERTPDIAVSGIGAVARSAAGLGKPGG